MDNIKIMQEIGKSARRGHDITSLMFVNEAQKPDTTLDAATIAEHYYYFLEWYEHEWKKGSIVIDPTNALLYKASDDIGLGQKHYMPHEFLSAGGWKAIADPNIEYPEYSEIIGNSDGYMIGDKVTFKGQRYISNINDNVWTPEGYPRGWDLVE